MHEQLKIPVQFLLNRKDLSGEMTAQSIGTIMDGVCDSVDIAAFLTAMAAKGPTPEELAGAARAMRQRATVIRTQRHPLLDTCGTGGDCLHTFNISTATAILAAACGICVAKHGNRSVSSSSGSADVLDALGVNISLPPESAGLCLNELGIAFCFAPLVHGAMKHAAPVRRQLGFPTIFNLLGPLTNPAGAEFQILGASNTARAELLARALVLLGGTRAFVVCGNDELDEISLWGRTSVFEVNDGQLHRHEWTAAVFGLPECRASDLRAESPADSARIIRAIFDGEPSCRSDIVLANAAAALLLTGRVTSLRDGVNAARDVVVSGSAGVLLNQLSEWTRSH